MTDLNHVVLIGRLTRDLGSDERSFGYIGNGTARANVSIAVNRSKKTGDGYADEVNYFDVTIWGKLLRRYDMGQDRRKPQTLFDKGKADLCRGTPQTRPLGKRRTETEPHNNSSG